MYAVLRRAVGLAAALVCSAAVGCAPRFAVRLPYPVVNAQTGPVVRVLPFQDTRAKPFHVSTGYVGMYQERQNLDAHPETPPAEILSEALATELAQRGLKGAATGLAAPYEVGCKIGQFLLRYRNYAGAFSATDGWGYLDLNCQVTVAGQTVWEGPIYARHHRVFYVAGIFGSFSKTVWPELSGALVQQVAAVLNRAVFHQAAAPQMVQEARQRLASSDPDQRYLGAYVLGVSGDPVVVPLLMRYVEDPDKKVRRAVVDALGTIGAREALPVLLRRFDGEDGNVKWSIIKDVLQLGDPQGFIWLRERAAAIKADTLREIVSDVLAHQV